MVDQPPHPPTESPAGGTGPFPDDVWREIFIHARLPVPKPLSRPERSELRQQTLTVLARTCKLSNSIAIPLLYKTVVTDNISSFFEIKYHPTRRALIALVEHLYIEYQDDDISIPYQRLLNIGGSSWDRIGPSRQQAERLQMERCREELRYGLWPGPVMDLFQSGMEKQHVLPRLNTVAIGSIYGHQDTLWSRYEKYEMAEAGRRKKGGARDSGGYPPFSAVAECRDTWGDFLGTTTVAHVCVRDPTGPLGFPTHLSETASQKSQGTIHFVPNTPGLGFHLGRNPVWVSDLPQGEAWDPLFEAVKRSWEDLFAWRVNSKREKRSDSFQVDIYGSTSRLLPPSGDWVASVPIYHFLRDIPGAYEPTLSIACQQAICGAIGAYWTHKEETSRDPWQDIVRWRPSHDYPGCKACGSGPPI